MYLHNHFKHLNTSLNQIDPFDPLMRPYQVLLIKIRVDLGVISTNVGFYNSESDRTLTSPPDVT